MSSPDEVYVNKKLPDDSEIDKIQTNAAVMKYALIR